MTDSTSSDGRPFRILALDSALGAASACVWEVGGDRPLAVESITMERGHAEALVPLMDRVVRAVDGDYRTIDQVAVTVGPGSFTGLRIGVSAARAVGLALSVPVVGVTTLAAYAAPLVARDGGFMVASAIDARHGSVYFQGFAPAGRTMIAPRVLSLRDAARAIGGGPAVISGTGAALLAVECWSLGLKVDVADIGPAPDITWVARLGLAADPETALPRPLYIKAASVTPQEGAKVQRR